MEAQHFITTLNGNAYKKTHNNLLRYEIFSHNFYFFGGNVTLCWLNYSVLRVQARIKV